MCGIDLWGFVKVILCCVWVCLLWVCWIEFVLCVGEFEVGLGELVFAVCFSVWCGFEGDSLCCVVEVWVRLGE